MLKPIEIVGGGLAGLSLGLALMRRDVPVRVVEAGVYPRHRVCGEFIAGLDAQTRDELGLTPFLEDGLRLSRVTWHRQGRRIASHRLPDAAVGISRYRLDLRLAQAFEAAGGILEVNTRAPVTAGGEGTVLAAGRRPRVTEWMGLKAHIRGLEVDGDLEVHLGHSSYVGLCPVGPGEVNVCGLIHRDRVDGGRGARWFLEQLENAGFHVLKNRIQDDAVDEASIVTVAGLDFEQGDPPDGLLRLGDSIGAIPPFTGHGMALAFQSAAAALPHLEGWSAGVVEWPDVVQGARLAFTKRSRRCFRMARYLHPWLLSSPRQRVFALLQQSGLLPLGAFTRLVHL